MKNALIDHVTSERSKKHVEAMLDDSRKKCQEIVNAKLLAEKSKLETELENRELKYLLEQEKESCHSYELVLTQLREQILKTEEQLSRYVYTCLCCVGENKQHSVHARTPNVHRNPKGSE